MSQYFDNKELFTGPKVNQYGSHMLMTNVTKTRKYKYVNIDTKFRDEYNSNTTSDYNITLPERITDVRSISVTNVEIPITFFNISENLGNNAMKVGSTALVVPDGEYTLTTLVDALNARRTALTIAITFSYASNKITITADSGTFAIDFGVDSIGGFAKYNFKSRLGWLMGFRSQTYSISSSGTTTMTSEFLVDLSGPRYLYLVIDEFTGNGNQKSFVSPLPSSVINKNILARIPLNKQTYAFMSVLPVGISTGLLTDVRSYTGKVDIQKLNIQLVNENGIAMNLNGADFSFCLEIEHE
jgi:hypothetical protein